MTREEAINHLKTVAKSAIDSGYDSAVVDAVDMAREALEQQPKYCDRNICIRNDYNGIGCGECEVTKSQDPCEDAISRQAALNILDDMVKDYIKENDFDKAQGVAWVKVQKLPPVTPQPQTGEWIPVSERLPDKLQDVVVTFYDAEGECDIAYMRKTFNVSYKAQGSENEWVSSMGETTYADYEVSAWMPLPKPYKAESEVQDADCN